MAATKRLLKKLRALPLGIGSLPHTDVAAACAAVLDAFPQSPFWPELPRRDWRESMGIEQARGLPGFVVDEKAQLIYFDSQQDSTAGLELFYEDYLAGSVEKYGVSPEVLPGLEAMISAVKERSLHPIVLKGQLTGPTTLGLVLKDDHKKALLYNEQMMDVLVKATAMKAAFMSARMATVGDQSAIFFDEPMLQSIGSAAIPIDREIAVGRLKEVIEAVDCVTGGHCCGNTDWSILIDAGIDIVAFDAWRFAETIALYPVELRSLLERGGLLAWGIVPASGLGAETDIDALFDRLINGIDFVAQKCALPAATLIEQCLVTPSCGLGSLTEAQAEAVLAKTAAIAERIANY